MMTRLTSQRLLAACGAIVLLTSSSLYGNVTDDRRYLLGEDAGENAVAGQVVGTNSTPESGLSRDSQGPSGAFNHLVVQGVPTYVSVSDRPGAGSTLGASFGGPMSFDRLWTTTSMNVPSDFWDSQTHFPGSTLSQNYEGIYGHGIQLWAKPNAATQGVRQDLVLDTPQNGIFINAANRWGLQFSGASLDSTAPVTYGSWAHVMQLVGFNDPDDGRSNLTGALYVNGVAVSASFAYNGFSEDMLSVGSNVTGDGNFYHGVMDNVRIFLWGNNSRQTNAGAGPFGKDWGNLNLAQDNEWIARQLQTLGVTDPADVNLDGTVNAADVTAFLPDWRKVRTVNGIRIGDWVSRQDSDLNYDGIVDLKDAYILNDGLVSAGVAGGLNFELLGAAVPEPASAALLAMALLGLRGARRRRGC